MQKLFSFFLIVLFATSTFAQTGLQPLSQQEFVKLLYQVNGSAAKRGQLVEAIRKRGLGFELTSGLRGLVATKSGNDELLRRTLDEAVRRRENPQAFTPPNEKEAADVLEKARAATLAAVEEMPDFVVKQLVSRAYAYAKTNNWKPTDKLTIAVSYSADKGENYKVLAINGAPQPDDKSNFAYTQVGGTTSAGEFVTVLSSLFKPDSKTEFEAVDTDTLRGRRCIVYSFKVKRENSQQRITSFDLIAQSTISGYEGRLWIDRENFRVLRIEQSATEIPRDFPVTAASRTIVYDWVTIADQKYLLPILSDVRLTARNRDQSIDSRNLINFRNYQRYGSEVKILDDDTVVVEDDKQQPKKP